ncbi:MAG: hypothetical protein R3E79_18820 [Caldilineaceae bacterium]
MFLDQMRGGDERIPGMDGAHLLDQKFCGPFPECLAGLARNNFIPDRRCSMMIVWTDYFEYRIRLRGFERDILEAIVQHASERYVDTETQRYVVVGRHHGDLVMIAYEHDSINITPVTVHVTSRQQIRFRLRTGRLIHE